MIKNSLVNKVVGTVLVLEEYNDKTTLSRFCKCKCLVCQQEFIYTKQCLLKTTKHPNCPKAIYDPSKAIGKKYNQWTVLNFEYKKNGDNFYKCQCDCGRIEIISMRTIRHGSGHCRDKIHNKTYDIVGRKFGKLKVIKQVEMTKYGQRQFLCQCDCGKEKVILGANLIYGESKSCGCELEKYYKEGTHLKHIKNKEAYSNSKSGIKGVYENKSGYWTATIRVKGEMFSYYGGAGKKGKEKCIKWREEMVEKYHKPIIDKYVIKNWRKNKMEENDGYTKMYDCKSIIKFKKINNTTIETYIVVKNGLISVEINENGETKETYQLGSINHQ